MSHPAPGSLSGRLLLDTHVFLWWAEGQTHRISAEVRTAVVGSPEVYVSIASAWELAIKTALQKLRFTVTFRYAMDVNEFIALPVSLDHIDRLTGVPPHHRDPFDRIMIAQALHEGLTLVTHDRALAPYRVPTLWA